MKSTIRILCVLFLLGIVNVAAAQEITKKRGKYKIYSSSGKLHSQGKVKNYHRNGEWKYYDEEGHIVTIANFVLDTIHGPYTDFFADGKISVQGTYCKNQKCGNWKTYDMNGQLISDENFVNAQQHGVQRYWYPGGRLRDSIAFSYGNVLYRKAWYASGGVKTIETYTNGLAEGRWVVYPETRVDTFAQTVDDFHLGKRHGWHYQWNGASLIEAYQYVDGLPDGTFTRYAYDGQPVMIQNYTKGYLHGNSTYFKDGKKLNEENYFWGAKDGLQIEYDRNEKVSKGSWYREGILDSSHSYFPNGKVAIRKFMGNTPSMMNYMEWDSSGALLMKGNLKGENRDGEWTTFYPDGKIRSTMHYNNGKLEGLYTKFYPNGKKLIQYTFLPVGTNTPPDVWNEKGTRLKPGTKQYDEIVEGNRPGEIFSDPSEFQRSIIRHLLYEEDENYDENNPDQLYKMEVDDAMALEQLQEPGNDSDEVYSFCEVMPEFPGGQTALQTFIMQNVKWPADDHFGLTTAYVEYIVEKDGRVTNVKAVKNPDDPFVKEVVRVVGMFPRQTPPLMNGRPVRCKIVIPIRAEVRD